MAVNPATAAALTDARAADAVERIAALLVDSAVVVDDQATWLTPQLIGDLGATAEGGEVAPINGRTGVACLYDGSAGIGWSLAVVGVHRGRADLTVLAAAALRHGLARAGPDSPPGLYDGAAGVGLAAVAGGVLLGVEELIAGGVELLRAAGSSSPAGDDLIDGTAGIALACLRGAQLTGDDALFTAAQQQAETLVARAHRRAWGWCWPSGDEPGLCGLAHGAAGAAWALGEVGGAIGRVVGGDARSASAPIPGDLAGTADRLRAARDAARHYERSWFDPRSSTWPDLRGDVAGPDGTPPRPNLWCHGGVGIGLSRLALHAIDPHPALAGEAVAAAAAAGRDAAEHVAAGVLPSGLTVCHGLGGTLALLVTAADHLDAPEHLDTARWLLSCALEHLGTDPAAWPGGLLHEPGPGLMTGLAGTMLVLAGLDDPAALAPITRLSV